MIPLVTPTSQIVGTQAVINVLTGERYKSIAQETSGILKGEYGATPAPVNKELQLRVLEGADAITCRPADNLRPEVEAQTTKLISLAKEKDIRLADNVVDDVLIYALFPQVGLRFLEHRDDPSAFEPAPVSSSADRVPAATSPPGSGGAHSYFVRVNGKLFTVEVSDSGDITSAQPQASAPAAGVGDAVTAILAGTIFKVNVAVGDVVTEGQPLLVLEAMKMETQISAPRDGTVNDIFARVGDSVSVGDALIMLA